MNIVALANLLGGLLLFFISLPLIYRKVPMNNLYGVRIPAAFQSQERWYEINAYGGRQLAAWSWAIIITGAAGFFIPDKYIPIYAPACAAVFLLAVLVPLVRIMQWAGKLPPNENSTETKTRTALPSPPWGRGIEGEGENAQFHYDVHGEATHAPAIPPSDIFSMKKNLIPAIALVALCVGYVIFITHSAAWLPARVATHFGASGRPNGWMSRESYTQFILILGLAIAVFIGGVGLVLAVLQSRLKLAFRVAMNPQAADKPPRRSNLSWLGGDILWFACLVLCFIAGTHYLVIQANGQAHPHLSSASLVLLITAFSIGNVAWLILLIFHLTRKSDEP